MLADDLQCFSSEHALFSHYESLWTLVIITLHHYFTFFTLNDLTAADTMLTSTGVSK